MQRAPGLTVSPRSLAAGGVEVTERATGERRTIGVGAAESFLREGGFPAGFRS